MKRVTLIHWNAAEGQERLQRLRLAGCDADFLMPQGGKGLDVVRANPPSALVIDLSRLPSHGRTVAVFLRQKKATRFVPIVFVDGDPAKVETVRKVLPDAIYTRWDGIRQALRRAMESSNANPVVPGTMSGYSGTPLPKKLGIRSGSVVALLGAPAGFAQRLGTLPENVRFRTQARGRADLILLFVKSGADLNRDFPKALRALAEKGRVWIIWPKKTSGLVSSLTQAAVREFGLAAGLVDYKICAVDATWSGLLFTRRPAARGSTGSQPRTS